MSVNDPMSERVTYTLPPEPDGPVWDKDGNKWEYESGFWKGTASLRWIVLLRDHGPLTNTEPLPAWPIDAFLWHNERVWARSPNGSYLTQGDHWHASYMDDERPKLCDGARRFAREAVPVVMVPAAEWWAFRASVTRGECHSSEAAALIDATDALGAGEQ